MTSHASLIDGTMRAGIRTMASVSGTDPRAGLVDSQLAVVRASGFHPWNSSSWRSSSAHTVGQWSLSVSGSMPMNRTDMTLSQV
jgi:hypothetical protein